MLETLTPDFAERMLAARYVAQRDANVEDAALWRWFSVLLDERRIRWCQSGSGWLVSVDHRHVATHEDFDAAMRIAKSNVCAGGSRRLDDNERHGYMR
ncbi:hypothetical protein [Paraburkholderia fungorum]|nr:hypothetical protein [Paraburkholderia fungorum]